MATIVYQGRVIGHSCRPEPEPEAAEEALLDGVKPEPNEPWTPRDLYARTVGNRRVMFLELVAWAIQQAEDAATRGKLSAFSSDLVWDRERDWKPMPWKGADKDPERFLKHVADLARGFTDDGGVYPLRRDAD